MSLHSQHYPRSSGSDKVDKAMVCVCVCCTQVEWTGRGRGGLVRRSIDLSALTRSRWDAVHVIIKHACNG